MAALRNTIDRILRAIPAVVVLATAATAAWSWIIWDAPRQERFLATASAVALGLILLFVWAITLSGWRRQTRLLLAAAVLAPIAAAGGLLRIRGVSGDLVPILEWRFARREQPATVSPTRPPSPASRETTRRAPSRDYPQFLGPARNGVVEGAALARDWTLRPPRLLWRRPVGAGWSAFAVAGDAAFTQEQRGEDECVACYSLADGEPRWLHSEKVRYETGIGGIGPRATPTVDGDRVYTLGATGLLSCLERATGKRLWSRDAVLENGSGVNEWGMSGSPLVHGGLVIVGAGGREGRSLVAYHQDSGEPAWQGGTARAGYSSPFHAVLAGVPQVIILSGGMVVAHDPATGKVLWESPWPGGNPSPAQPLAITPDLLLVSGGYGIGSTLYRVRAAGAGGIEVDVVWKSRALKSKFANFVRVDGFVYGLDDGIFTCIDLEDGSRRWKSGRYGHGQMILAGSTILLQGETGEVVLIEPTPEAHREVARFQALDGKTWNCPALAAPYLLVRNDLEAACYEMGME